MIYELINILWSALSACFMCADAIFTAVGIPFVTAVTVMVLISSVLRLFSARFIGEQINLGRERKAKSDARKAKENAKSGKDVK